MPLIKHKQITVLFRGGGCGNYLGANIVRYITNRITDDIRYDPVINEYFTYELDGCYGMNITHANLLPTHYPLPSTKVIVIHNNWDMAYTEALGSIKTDYKNRQDGHIPIKYDEESTIEYKKLQIEYKEASEELKQKGYDVFDVEFKDLFIDKNETEYLKLCTWLGHEYSLEGYLHLSEYVDKNIALMENIHL
tara:strand:+ start:4882 stop:5460 length:579 start_codon:yes stop_codon:yes gene_type:complete